VLRNDLELNGPKYGCGLGECGTCTVLIDDKPRYACTTLALEAEGRELETVEGLADGQRLHPIQQSFIDNFAFQCGFCTPGMILATKSLLEDRPTPTAAEVTHWLEGNLCRCTGYRTIVEAVLDASDRMKEAAS
jgi:carbon-monoxide dehydrogenase small subunit